MATPYGLRAPRGEHRILVAPDHPSKNMVPALNASDTLGPPELRRSLQPHCDRTGMIRLLHDQAGGEALDPLSRPRGAACCQMRVSGPLVRSATTPLGQSAVQGCGGWSMSKRLGCCAR